MPQLHAAYCIPEMLEHLPPSTAPIARELLRSLAHFELESNRRLQDPGVAQSDADQTSSLLAVAMNLISRGLPTRAPLALSDAVLRAAWPGTFDPHDDELRGVGFDLGAVSPAFVRLLMRALHVVEPRMTAEQFRAITKKYGAVPLDSGAERTFLNDIVAGNVEMGLGLAQVMLPQVPLDQLLQFGIDDNGDIDSPRRSNDENPSFAQHVDFAMPLPYAWPDTGNAPRGLVMEVDGPHHKEKGQRIKDAARDKAAHEARWRTDRLPVEEMASPDAFLHNLLDLARNHPYCKTLRLNCKQPLHASDDGRRAEQIFLTPILAARIHRALLEALTHGILKLDEKTWRVTVIERDVPGAHLGVQAFCDQLGHLFALKDDRSLPALQLTVYTTPQYAGCALHQGHAVHPLDAYRPDAATDLILDVAVLSRPLMLTPMPVAQDATLFTIRSSAIALTRRHVATAPLVHYAHVCSPDPGDEYLHVPVQEKVDALRFFLRDIFRKADFRPGQLPILNRGLQGKSVLGLLPTGGGKSLTYQLAALLQPGVCLVVDPIKSLMQDQFEGLLANWIDAASFINSSVLSTREQREARLIGGEVLFFFLSPERLQIQRFRDQLQRMHSAGPRHVGFSFCVVDEAHCVSEWGHDFRTQYLRLGTTVRRYCHTHDGEEAPIYGLTATASFDVLADVQRELALPGQEAIIRTRTTRRRELLFQVLPVSAQGKHKRILDLLDQIPEKLADWSIRAEAERISEIEQYRIDPDSIPSDYAPPPRSLAIDFDPSTFYQPDGQGHYPHAGLIFCPHKSKKILSGVESVLPVVEKKAYIKAGKFTSGNAAFGAPDSAKEASDMMRMQREFVGSQLNLLVATKAFGMGIDKPNVRFTIHYAYPSSIESLVQEAGRAGRDRVVALNYILFDKEDASINASFYNRSFRGRNKEALMIHELLECVSLPASSQLDHLREVLLTEFEGAVIAPLSLWPKNDPKILYVNQAFKESYGSINLGVGRSLRANLNQRHCGIEADLAEKICARIIGFIEQEAPPETRNDTATLAAWLAAHTAHTTIAGILPTLRAAPSDETHPTLVIGFKNGAASELAQALGNAMSETLIWDAAGFASDGAQFLDVLDAKHAKATGSNLNLTAEQAELAQHRFAYLRDEQDTYKAVHRLTLLGVVDDYTLDYGAKTITLSLNRLPSDENDCIGRLASYLERYTTTVRALEIADRARLRKRGHSLLEKALGQLIDFTYEEVATKRKRATEEMAGACEKGISDPGEDLGEFFDLYFNSKYARVEFLPADTEKGKRYTPALVWKYLDYMTTPPDGLGKERDNVKHLRGACARMLSSGGDKNGAILLLDGFALLFLEYERTTPAPKIMAAATEKLLRGFGCYLEQEKWSDTQLLDFIDEYAAYAAKFDPRVAEYIRQHVREQVLFDVQLRWLKQFNDRFDDRFDDRPTDKRRHQDVVTS